MRLCRVRRHNLLDIRAMDAEAAGDLGIGEPVSFETADLSHLDADRRFAAFVFTSRLGRRNPFTLIEAVQTTTISPISTRTPTVPTTRLGTNVPRPAHGLPERPPTANFNQLAGLASSSSRAIRPSTLPPPATGVHQRRTYVFETVAPMLSGAR